MARRRALSAPARARRPLALVFWGVFRVFAFCFFFFFGGGGSECVFFMFMFFWFGGFQGVVFLVLGGSRWFRGLGF